MMIRGIFTRFTVVMLLGMATVSANDALRPLSDLLDEGYEPVAASGENVLFGMHKRKSMYMCFANDLSEAIALGVLLEPSTAGLFGLPSAQEAQSFSGLTVVCAALK